MSLANSSASFAVGSGTLDWRHRQLRHAGIHQPGLERRHRHVRLQHHPVRPDYGHQHAESFGATANSIVINLNTSGQTFNSYPLFQFGSVTGFSASDFTMGSGTTAGYTYGFTQSGGTIDLTITGTGSNNLPTQQSLSWAVGSGSWNTSVSTSANWTGGATYVDGDAVTFGEPTANNSTVTISGSAVTPLSLTISNTSNSYNITGGSITGTTALYKTGAGLATLSNSNTYTGGTFITGGTLATGPSGDAALGASSGGVTLDTNGTLQFTTSNVTSSRAVTVNAGGGTIVTSSGTAAMSGTLTIANNGTFNTAGSGTLAFTNTGSKTITTGTNSTISVQSGNLQLIADAFVSTTTNAALNVAPSAALTLNTTAAPNVPGQPTSGAASSTFVMNGGATINGNLVVPQPLTLQVNNASNGYSTIGGSGAIQFQNMQTPPEPTHFTTASAQGITMGGNLVSAEIDCNIQLNSTNQQFFKTSISQSGAIANGNGFILGNGVTDSFFWIYPSSGNSLYMYGVISGSCDVQLGEVGGGGAASNIYLNAQNTYSGVTMFEQGVKGNVYLGVPNALPTTTDLIFAPINGNSYQQTLELAGNNQTVASLSYWADANGDGTSNAVTVQNTSGAATLTVSGATSPSRPYGGLLGDGGGGFGGLLTLVKDGTNTLWLNNGHNSYSGGTTVMNGLLLLTPTDLGSEPGLSSVTGEGDVTVSGGTLQGTANLNRADGDGVANLIVGANGTVRPGAANPLVAALAVLNVYQTVPCQPGTLTVGNATFAAGANMEYDFAPNGASLLTASSILLPSSGSVAIRAAIGGLGGNGTSYVFPLMQASSSLSNSGALTLGAHSLSYSYSISSPNSLEVDLKATYLGPLSLTWAGGNGNFWGGANGEFLRRNERWFPRSQQCRRHPDVQRLGWHRQRLDHDPRQRFAGQHDVLQYGRDL